MGYSSGNAVVDEMGTWSIAGNVVPQEWYRTITRENGKPYLLAILILSDIVYWYRPMEIRDECSGQVIGWKKRFRGDMLQKSYGNYATFFGESKRSVKASIDHLVNMGAIRRAFRDVRFGGDEIMRNVMYLEPIPEALMALTYPDEIIKTSGHGVQRFDSQKKKTGAIETLSETDKSSMMTGYERDGLNDSGGSYKKMYDVVQNFVPPPTEKSTTSCNETYHVIPNDVSRPTPDCRTNTETTTEITDENQIHPSGSVKVISMRERKSDDVIDVTEETDQLVRLLKKNLEYDIMLERYTGSDRDLYETIFRVICHVVCGKGPKRHRIGNLEFPHETVKGVFMKLTPEHVGIVMEGYQGTATKVTDMGAYLTAALYNAYLTGDLYWDRRVKHDMYGGGWEEKGIANSTDGGKNDG